MSDTNEQLQKARAIMRRMIPERNSPTTLALMEQAISDAVEFLKATEPKHAAVVAWEEYCLSWSRGENRKQAFLAGYRAGMLEAADLVKTEKDHHITCVCAICEDKKRIRDAAAKVPVE